MPFAHHLIVIDAQMAISTEKSFRRMGRVGVKMPFGGMARLAKCLHILTPDAGGVGIVAVVTGHIRFAVFTHLPLIVGVNMAVTTRSGGVIRNHHLFGVVGAIGDERMTVVTGDSRMFIRLRLRIKTRRMTA